MHCDVNPMLLIQGMANDDAIIACSSLAKVGAANCKILYSLLHHAVEVASKIKRQSSWDDSGPVTARDYIQILLIHTEYIKTNWPCLIVGCGLSVV